jgi:phosphate ABC transporter phosphate-binding protein
MKPPLRTSARRATSLHVLLLLLLAARAPAQQPSAIHTVFVEAADFTPTTRAVEQEFVHRIESAGTLKVASNAKLADAILRVHAVLWPSATYAPNPKSRTTVVSDYEGYASADLETPANQPLWSYLVTPSRFHLGGPSQDLATQLFESLRTALKNGTIDPEAASAQSAPRVAGATFPAPLYRKWFESYAEHTSTPPISYDATGSVTGLALLAAGKIDMAASDIPGTPETAAAEAQTLRVPTVVGGVVPIFNLPGASRDLRLTAQLLAEIYSGKIARWNDPQLREANPGADLPNAPIHVVHRSDGSGTTFVFTSFLATASPAWRGKVAPSVDWPTGVGETGNEGVAGDVASTPDSIGYVELTFAIQHRLAYASVRNPAGRYIRADLASLTAAAQTAGTAAGASLLNAPGPNSYPIATFTYFLLPNASANAQQHAALLNFLRWMLTAGQHQCASLAYAPLPKALADAELALLQ